MTTIQNQVGQLRRVYVRPPRAEDLVTWREYGWRAEPDAARAREEHEAFVVELERAGAQVVTAVSEVAGDPDAIYAYDPVLMTDRGAVLLRPGKLGRRREPEGTVAGLGQLGDLVRQLGPGGVEVLEHDLGAARQGRGEDRCGRDANVRASDHGST